MQDKIARLLAASDRDDDANDTSLRGKALERAMSERVPRTLTPYEWQEWYEEHGVPQSHRQPESDSQPGLLSRIFQTLRNWRE